MDKRELIVNVKAESTKASVAGRIMSVRKMKNYNFCDIVDISAKMQLIVATTSKLTIPNVGDIVLATGNVVTTKAGQLSVQCSDLQILSKGSVDVLNAIKSVSTPGLEFNGQRSLNLMVNDNLKNMRP